ncbi:hypothetical protein ACN9ML_01660 [Dyadobacter endophyticus]|uniref:hypothetical protein n=1 Tax=Dyadobacter TaxID=120831 RepID=UPI003CF44A1D
MSIVTRILIHMLIWIQGRMAIFSIACGAIPNHTALHALGGLTITICGVGMVFLNW